MFDIVAYQSAVLTSMEEVKHKVESSLSIPLPPAIRALGEPLLCLVRAVQSALGWVLWLIFDVSASYTVALVKMRFWNNYFAHGEGNYHDVIPTGTLGQVIRIELDQTYACVS